MDGDLDEQIARGLAADFARRRAAFVWGIRPHAKSESGVNSPASEFARSDAPGTKG